MCVPIFFVCPPRHPHFKLLISILIFLVSDSAPPPAGRLSSFWFHLPRPIFATTSPGPSLPHPLNPRPGAQLKKICIDTYIHIYESAKPLGVLAYCPCAYDAVWCINIHSLDQPKKKTAESCVTRTTKGKRKRGELCSVIPTTDDSIVLYCGLTKGTNFFSPLYSSGCNHETPVTKMDHPISSE